MSSAADKRAQFRKLHEDGCFVIPNPWDAGSARLLQGLGFKALASTSSGMAWSMGLTDYDVSLDEVVSHLTKLSAATDLRLKAARAAIDADGTGAVLVGRAEGVLFGHMDVKQTLERLVAIAEAGADCL